MTQGQSEKFLNAETGTRVWTIKSIYFRQRFKLGSQRQSGWGTKSLDLYQEPREQSRSYTKRLKHSGRGKKKITGFKSGTERTNCIKQRALQRNNCWNTVTRKQDDLEQEGRNTPLNYTGNWKTTRHNCNTLGWGTNLRRGKKTWQDVRNEMQKKVERGVNSGGPKKSESQSRRVNNFQKRERTNKSWKWLTWLHSQRKVLGGQPNLLSITVDRICLSPYIPHFCRWSTIWGALTWPWPTSSLVF